MTTIYLIRHAERDTPAEVLPGQAPGIVLTDHGRRQAARLARRLAACPITHVFSSPLERAVETAGPLARLKGLPVETVPSVTEIDFGTWTGKRFSELEGDARWRHFNEFRSATRTPGGESGLEVQGRFVRQLLRWRDAFPDESVACFSHADPIRLALVYFLGAPVDLAGRLEIAMGSISVLGLADWGARVLRTNDVPEE